MAPVERWLELMINGAEAGNSGGQHGIANGSIQVRAAGRDAIVPLRLELLIGGYFGTSYALKLQPGGLLYNRCRHAESSPAATVRPELLQFPRREAWHRFHAELDALNVWAWRRYYPNVAGVCDGYGFHLRIDYPDRQLIACGDHCFPGNNGDPVPITARTAGDPFDQFCGAVSRLAGRPFR